MAGYTGNKEQLLTRLRRIEGQVRGLQRMIDEDKYCIDVLTQISAVQSGLKGVAVDLLNDHMSHCIAGAAESEPREARELVEEASAAIKRLLKA